MFRIDSTGATINNLFTEGNPSLGIIPTKVSDEWLNDAVQEEIANVVEGAGIVLNKVVNSQLLLAINTLISLGGTQVKQNIDNSAGATNIGTAFDKATVKAVQLFYDIARKDDGETRLESGIIMLSVNITTNSWELSGVDVDYGLNPSGVVLSIDAAGQLSYTSDNMVGGNYSVADSQIRYSVLSLTK